MLPFRPECPLRKSLASLRPSLSVGPTTILPAITFGPGSGDRV